MFADDELARGTVGVDALASTLRTLRCTQTSQFGNKEIKDVGNAQADA